MYPDIIHGIDVPNTENMSCVPQGYTLFSSVVKVMGCSVPKSGELVMLQRITSISVPEFDDELFCT